jgi:Protein of unknown function (DUF3014)
MADGDNGRLRDGPLFEGLARRHRSGGARIIVWTVAVVLLLGVAIGGWLWWRSRQAPQSKAAAAGAAVDSAAHAGAASVAPLALPPLESSDSLVRNLVVGLSSRPQLSRWLVTDDLVQRFVAVVVDLAAGASPASHVRFLAPRTPFRAQRAHDRLVIDTASYRRYDALTDVVVSMDTRGAARLYHELHPLFEEAYRKLGIRNQSFDETLAQAIGNLLAVKVPDGPIVMEPHGAAAYRFADPALEGLTPAAKHLLRLGPANARRIQEKLRELADAAGIVPIAATGS